MLMLLLFKFIHVMAPTHSKQNEFLSLVNPL